MSWDLLIGQQPAKKYLCSSLSGGRLSHAYLFKGPGGIGKRTAAYVFAQAVLCERRGETGRACGTCKSCRWFAARKGAQIDHPDVISLLKFSKSKGKNEGQGREEQLLGDQENIIPLETIQHVCEQLHRSPMAGRRRVVIIPEAQRLCRGQAEPANAFLKTLEEPPRAALIILTSSQPEGLLETITSRVQAVQFRRLAAEEIKLGLQRNAPQSEQTQTVAALADGSLGRALELLQGDLGNWRKLVLYGLQNFGPLSAPQFGITLWNTAEAEGVRLFAANKEASREARQEAAENDDPSAAASDEADKSEAGWKRYVLRRLLEIVEVCFRDALICAAAENCDPGLLMQPDQAQLSKRLAGLFGVEGCQKALSALRESFLAARLYVRGDVIGRALAGRFVDALLPRVV
jgi:DNA polymerase III delta' subunit